MSVKEIIFLFYNLGLSLYTLSRLYNEASVTQLNQLLKGDFLELQFSLDIFNDYEIELLSSIDKIENSKNKIKNVLNRFAKNDINYFIYFEDGYPSSLKKIPMPPFFIFTKGNLDLLESKKKMCNRRYSKTLK